MRRGTEGADRWVYECRAQRRLSPTDRKLGVSSLKVIGSHETGYHHLECLWLEKTSKDEVLGYPMVYLAG